MHSRIVLTVTAVAALVAACGGDNPPAAPSPSCLEDAAGTAVEVHGTDALTFEPAQLAAPQGDVVITLVNGGALPHSLVIDGTPLRLDTRERGEECTGVVNLPAGLYEFWCDVPGHRQAGMEGLLTVE